jgi:lactate dehydrogenase-like 2-hydroxyacid dehydrogenase
VPRIDVIAAGGFPAKTLESLNAAFTMHRVQHGAAIPAGAAAVARGLARGGHFLIDAAMLAGLPKLEMIANFGVGYDGIDLAACAARGIIVTNTPDVLTEEVADTALGLLLMTVRELSAAERHLRAGKWPQGSPRLSPMTLRDRKVGIAGLGRIGEAIARRLVAMGVPVVYHNRRRRDDVSYRYFRDLKKMAEAVDTLIVVLPGGEGTAKLVDADVLKALGPRGVFINIGRGSAVDEPALIAALRDGTIQAAGLDVFANEPNVPDDLMALPNAVLLPHVGSGTIYTRDAMGELCVDNLKSWFARGRPLTPVPETPWKPKRKSAVKARKPAARKAKPAAKMAATRKQGR